MSEKNPYLQSIYISRFRGEAMERVSSVEALEGLGLEGDRYSRGEGFWQNVKNAREVVRQVSLIHSKAIEESSFFEHETRRNLVIAGEIDLISLIGKEFKVGEVVFLGVEDCTPCKRPSELSGRDGFAKEFKGLGGLRAAVVAGGILVPGNELLLVK